jgi:hypothetical protein
MVLFLRRVNKKRLGFFLYRDASGFLRDIEITKVPFIMHPFCTNGVAAHEDKHTGAQRRVCGSGGIDWASD